MRGLRPNPGHYSALGYQSSTRLSNIDGVTAAQGYSGDAHLDLSRDQLVALSRQFFRDNPIYRGIITRCASYVVGKGFALQARTGDSGWNKQAELLWNEFWKSPDIRGTFSGKRYESLVFQELITTGDVFSAFVQPVGDHLRLQMFESEQCISYKSGMDNGVVVNEYGIPTGYNLIGYSRGGYVRRGTKNLIDANNVIHIFDPERASSSRGVPALQSAFAMLHRLNDICDAEAIARQMLAHLAIAVNRQQAADLAYSESEADAVDSDFRIQELDYATIFHGAPGDTIAGIKRDIPGADFEASMQMFLRILGLPLGLPLEIVLLDWTKSNYSQSRAVLQQAFENFSYWQNMLKFRSMARIYKRKLAEWVGKKQITARADMVAHEWIAPSFPWLDEEKEIRAQAVKMELGLTSHNSVCKSLQSDREEVVVQREAEITDAIQRAQQIETNTGVSVPWQVFCGLSIQNAPSTTALPKPEPEPSTDYATQGEENVDDTEQ
jgi:lambda family phage portal protein